MNFSQSPTKLAIKVQSRVSIQNHDSIGANEHNSIIPLYAVFIYLFIYFLTKDVTFSFKSE
jgi:hypothetical protein